MTDVIDLEHPPGATDHRHEGRPRRRQIADWGVDDAFQRRERSARRRGGGHDDADARAVALDRVDDLPAAAGHGSVRPADDASVDELSADELAAIALVDGGEPVDPFAVDPEQLIEQDGERGRRERAVDDWFDDAPMPAPDRGRRIRLAEDWAESATRAERSVDDDPRDGAGAREEQPIDDYEARCAAFERLIEEDPDAHAPAPRARADREPRDGRAASSTPAPKGKAQRPRPPRGPSADELWSAGSGAAEKPQTGPRWTRPSLSAAKSPAGAKPSAAADGAARERGPAPPEPARAPEPELPREYRDDAGRRIVVVRGTPHAAEPTAATAALVARERNLTLDDARPRGIANPERLAAWAVGLGLLLILIAVSTANAATL